MCLTLKEPSFRVSDGTVKAYKRMRICGDYYRTPYQLMAIKKDTKEIIAKGRFKIQGKDAFIKGGVIHAYDNEQKARTVCCSDEVIMECIIPKHYYYWLGYNEEICAKKLIIINITDKDGNPVN